LNEWFALDLSAFGDPGDESAHGSLIEFLSLSEDWEELFIPVVLVDLIASCFPSGENINHSSVMGCVLLFELVGVNISLSVVKIDVPFWNGEWATAATATNAAHIFSLEQFSVELAAIVWVGSVPVATITTYITNSIVCVDTFWFSSGSTTTGTALSGCSEEFVIIVSA